MQLVEGNKVTEMNTEQFIKMYRKARPFASISHVVEAVNWKLDDMQKEGKAGIDLVSFISAIDWIVEECIPCEEVK